VSTTPSCYVAKGLQIKLATGVPPRAVRKARHAHPECDDESSAPPAHATSPSHDPPTATTGRNHNNLRFFDQALRLYCPRHADCQWRRFSSVQYDGQPGNCGAEKDTL
jgi:hypothetical protein